MKETCILSQGHRLAWEGALRSVSANALERPFRDVAGNLAGKDRALDLPGSSP